MEVEAIASVPVNFLLKSGGNTLDQLSNSTNYSHTIKDINDDTSYKLSSIDIESKSEISKEFML